MPQYIAEKPHYSEDMDTNIQTVIDKIVGIQNLCAEIHEPLKNAIHDHQWYHYRNEARRAFDALALVEHDVYLLTQCISVISAKVWKLYYEENPDQIPEGDRKWLEQDS